MKKIFSILISICISYSVYAEPIKIGVSVPLTGTTVNWGKDILNGISFANEELAKGAYQLIVEDDKCDPKESVTVAHKLVNQDGVKYVLGMACSGPLLAAAPIYEKAKVLTIAGGASAAKISEAGDYIFRTWPSDALGAKTLADYIQKKHHRLGVLTEQTEYAQGLLAGIQKSKGDLKIFSEEYAPGATDFRTLLLRLKKQGVDAILLNPQGDSTLIPMLQQLHQAKLDIPQYAMYYGASETVRSLESKLLENLKFADVPEVDTLISAEGANLLDKFRAKYIINFSPMVILSAIESFKALDAAIRSGKDPKDYLYNTSFYGSLGNWSFDKKGDIAGINFVMKHIVNGKIEVIE